MGLHHLARRASPCRGLKDIAEALLEHETIDGENIERLMRGDKIERRPPPRRAAPRDGDPRPPAGTPATMNDQASVGASRKSFLAAFAGKSLSMEEREEATAAAHAIAIDRGAEIVRVHDVARQLPGIRLAEAARASAHLIPG